MYDLPIAADLAVRATRSVAWSARPDAPVVAPSEPRERFATRARARIAAGLHRLATALEPRRRQEQSTVCS
jgi:hypothetical protein